ncbi:lipase family protein [Halalkalibacter alkalisediminis]|uniref:Lipase family protein n=1 Tax=Halalkalibacter alkalisediminis TaxID=935616 RepID=A0ABV6NHY8_9BACI|nr:lipase family protein [Halalkalibacter alkalisediminis]
MYHSDKKKLPLFLANCCLQTYNQFEHNGDFTIPKGYKKIASFKAVAFWEEEWFGFVIESKHNIIIAFRGTDSDPDWIIDAEVSQTPFPFTSENNLVHTGFLSTYESCRNTILESLNTISRKKTIYVTGHSLGAALATLCAYDLATNRLNTYLYTFASPRVGDTLFAKAFNTSVKQSQRYVNVFDIVPLLPPESIYSPTSNHPWHYQHVLQEKSFGIQTDTLRGNHSIYTYIKGVAALCKN